MENFDKVIRKKSIKGSTVKAYYAGTGTIPSPFLINPQDATDENIASACAILSNLSQTTDFYMDIIFPSFINNIRKLEYITSFPNNETYIEDEVYVQYLPSTSTITVDTPPSDFDDGTSGPGSKDDFITIDNNPFPYITLEGLLSGYKALVTELDSKINTQRIRYRFSNRSTAAHYLNEFRIYTEQGEYSFEFNDSVLTTKAWNSSRYSGRQLQASAINEFTSGDVTYGKTPVLQNYTKNIYLGSRVIGMESGSNDDPTLTQFNGFSYVTVHEYITVNDDLSITRKSIRSTGDEKRDFVSKKGFYPIFYHDFPIGSEIEINTLDEKLVESLKPSYKVFNNSGQLQRLLLVQSHPDSGSKYNVHYSQSNQLFYATGSNVNSLGAKFTIFNQRLIMDEFFTGSLVATPPAWVPGGSNPTEDSGDAVVPI